MTISTPVTAAELRIQLSNEKAKYSNAIKSNQTFETLKEIKLKIKQLEYSIENISLSN